MIQIKYIQFLFSTLLILLLISCDSFTKDTTGEISKHDNPLEDEKTSNDNENFELKLNCETTTIAHRKWTSENYKGTHFRNGDPIPRVNGKKEWDDISRVKKKPAYCIHKGIYFYNWYAINDSRGFAPKGWEVPSIDQWNQLIFYYQKDSVPPGIPLRSSKVWKTDEAGNNSSGFNAIPTGEKESTMSGYSYFGFYAHYWARDSYENTSNLNGYVFTLSSSSDLLYGSAHLQRKPKSNGFPVRFVKEISVNTPNYEDPQLVALRNKNNDTLNTQAVENEKEIDTLAIFSTYHYDDRPVEEITHLEIIMLSDLRFVFISTYWDSRLKTVKKKNKEVYYGIIDEYTHKDKNNGVIYYSVANSLKNKERERYEYQIQMNFKKNFVSRYLKGSLTAQFNHSDSGQKLYYIKNKDNYRGRGFSVYKKDLIFE